MNMLKLLLFQGFMLALERRTTPSEYSSEVSNDRSYSSARKRRRGSDDHGSSKDNPSKKLSNLYNSKEYSPDNGINFPRDANPRSSADEIRQGIASKRKNQSRSNFDGKSKSKTKAKQVSDKNEYNRSDSKKKAEMIEEMIEYLKNGIENVVKMTLQPSSQFPENSTTKNKNPNQRQRNSIDDFDSEGDIGRPFKNKSRRDKKIANQDSNSVSESYSLSEDS